MEKSLTETADDALNSRPALRSEKFVAQDPENIQSDSHHPIDSNRNDENNAQYVTGIRLAAITSAVTLTAFLITLDTSIISTAIPKITSEFHSLQDVGWYGSAYLLTSSALQPMTGKLYAHFSLKYTYIAFLAFFEFGSLICGLATSSNMLIVGRALAGIGSAGIGNGALTIMSASVPLKKRALYFSITGSIGQLGVVLGPLIGGIFTEYTTWRWCFYINLPIGGIAIAALLWVAVPNIPTEKPKLTAFTSLFHELDLAGCLLFAPTMTMFLLALEWGGSTYPWGSSIIIGLFCGSAANLVLFLIWEKRKGESAMIPFQMIKRPVVYSAGFNIFFLFANNVIVPYYLAIYFQGVKGKTPTLSGVYMLPGILSQIVFGLLGGVAVTRIGYYLPWAVLGSVLTAVGSGLISLFTQHTNTGSWIGYQIIGGVGRGLALQIPFIAVQNNLPASQIAISMAFLGFCRNFGGALILAFAEIIFNIGLGNALVRYAPEISLAQVTAAGVSGIQSIVPQTSVEGVISAYVIAIQDVFYLVAGTAVAALVFSASLGWKNVKKTNDSV